MHRKTCGRAPSANQSTSDHRGGEPENEDESEFGKGAEGPTIYNRRVCTGSQISATNTKIGQQGGRSRTADAPAAV